MGKRDIEKIVLERRGHIHNEKHVEHAHNFFCLLRFICWGRYCRLNITLPCKKTKGIETIGKRGRERRRNERTEGTKWMHNRSNTKAITMPGAVDRESAIDVGLHIRTKPMRQQSDAELWGNAHNVNNKICEAEKEGNDDREKI